MLDLLLLRHAKSDWDDPALEDRDRPLNRRGQRLAALMGDYIGGAGLVPDYALVSTAQRTRETWAADQRRWTGNRHPRPTSSRSSIWRCHPASWPASGRPRRGPQRLLVLGHNPGLERLARRLTGAGSDAAAAAALHGKFPTAALAWLQFDASDWSQIREGRLVRFVVPKDLEEAAGGD